MEKHKKNKVSGITLIALVVTIVVLLILAGVSISMLTGDNGTLNKAAEAKIRVELSGYKEELDLYKITKTSENMNFLDGSLTAGKTNLFYNTQKSGETGNIKTIIPDLSDTYFNQMEIIKGELLLNTKDVALIRIAQSLNIKVNPYDIVDGELLSSTGNLLLMDDNGTITIPDSVTKIGEGAFSNLEGLKTIIIPGTVKEIGARAFINNSTLEHVIIKDGVEIIGISAFEGCKKLKKVEMANSVINIGAQAFYQAHSLEEISISTGLTEISAYGFCQCKAITEIELPEHIKTIKSSAFADCTNLTQINIPEDLETIEKNVFQGVPLNTINISSENERFKFEDGTLVELVSGSIIYISNNAVSGNTFNVPSGVKKLEGNLLASYTTIVNLNIPASVTNIDPEFIKPKITRSNNR